MYLFKFVGGVPIIYAAVIGHAKNPTRLTGIFH